MGKTPVKTYTKRSTNLKLILKNKSEVGLEL